MAEVLREERLQMKLAEVKIVFEDMLLELESGTNTTTTAAATFSDSITKFSGKLKQTAAENNSSASSNNNSAIGDGSSESTRSEIPAVAALENINPHILRGIKGFVEFRRVVPTKGLKNRDSDAKLECQKAQLRVLLKQKGPVRSNHLIIT